MARKPEIAELPTRLLLTELGSGKRYKKIFVFGGIGVVVLGGGIFAAARALDARDTAARESDWSALNTCLLGADPLKDGETASDRVSAVQLAVVGVAPERRGKPGEPAWPASCSVPAFALSEHAGSQALIDSTTALGKELKADANATGDHHAAITKAWADAAADKLKIVPGGDAVPAPKPAAPLFAGPAFRALPKFLSSTFLLSNVHEEPSPGAKVSFLIDQKDMAEGPVLCTATAAESVIHCAKVPEAVATLSPGLRLLGTNEPGARPFYFAGDRGQLGIFPADGKHAVAATVAYGAAARADGSLAFVVKKEGAKDMRLVVQPATGGAVESPLLQPTDMEGPALTGLFWEWFAHKSQGKSGSAAHLYARKIEGTNVRAAIDVGELDEASPPDKNDRDQLIAGCKSDEATVVRVRGGKNDSIAFFTGGRWSSPVKAPTHGGALTCRGIEAVSTSVDHVSDRDKDFPTIHQARCNTSGCTTTSVAMKQVLASVPDIAPADAASSVAADANGRMLFVWNAGYAGGLRMRLAAPDKFKDAEDVIITDGRDEKGDTKISSIAQIKVIAASTYALLFLSTTAGVKVLRVDPSGSVTPMQSAL